VLTTAITGAITAILTFFGVTPTATMVGGIWITVKIIIVALGAFIAWRISRKKKAAAEAEKPEGAKPG
jgi:hypothetical protein